MKYYFWVFLFFLTVYIAPLGGRPMLSPDEFRYAEIPREMIASGNWSAPTLLGVRYFEKPVLGYWLTAASFKCFGENAFALRLPAALGAGIAAFFIALLVFQAIGDHKVAALAAALFLTAGLVYGVGTTAVLDLPLTAFVTGVLCTAYLALAEPCFNRRKIFLLISCGLLGGGAFMVKGFIGLALPGVAVLGFVLWERRWKELWQMPWIPLVAAVAVVLPWAWAVHRAQPDFWRYFLVEEHWQRFTGGTDSDHVEPWWFFLPVLAGGIFPAAFPALPALISFRKTEWSRLFERSIFRFALLAFVLPFILLSCSGGKLPTYILPCFPGLAILAGGMVAVYFNTGGHNRGFRWVFDFLGGVFFVGGCGMAMLALSRFAELVPLRPLWCGLAGGVLAAGGVTLLLCRNKWRLRLYIFFGVFALTTFCGGFIIDPVTIGSKMPEFFLVQTRTRLVSQPDSTLIVTTRRLMQAAAWGFPDCEILVVDELGELDYGCAAADAEGKESPHITLEAFTRLVNRPDRGKTIVLMDSNSPSWLEEDEFDFGKAKRYEVKNEFTAIRLSPGEQVKVRQ
ncbi:MAG: phospholipid carrier-dependent glycosyltransferase [Victivallaceae bacterium]|nr:phospholipid carrier-dependent glycosyltransferase [Victivallaceae bacterium]